MVVRGRWGCGGATRVGRTEESPALEDNSIEDMVQSLQNGHGWLYRVCLRFFLVTVKSIKRQAVGEGRRG